IGSITLTYNRFTQRDVARAAGVSDMTVSRVMRGRGTVSERTKANVLSVVEDMGYVQNRLAGSLATSRSNQVAVVIPSLVNQVFSQVMSGISSELDKAGYNAVVGISDYGLEKEESLVVSMMSWRPAGMIVTDMTHTQKTRNILKSANIPVIEIMDTAGEPIDICVGMDHAKAGRMLADHLIAKGYRRFGYLGWSDNDFPASRRFDAIRERLAEQGLPLVAPKVYDSPPDTPVGKSGLRDLLASHRELDVVIFSNDPAAVGGLVYCIEHGIDVPRELAIAGFSGLMAGQIMPKRLTTIRTRRYDVGRIAARCVLNRLVGQAVDPVIDLGFELIAGETA
ncbi:MAG: LacI family DNA-binding transcriptional regulator, partial [Proteobacteria bacterium]|nr:LacI family DNA-binding transcriptional regulator [Pseudomonadota bacterium]